MHLLSCLAVAALATATSPLLSMKRETFMALGGLTDRQGDVCIEVPAPGSCEESCGPGNIQCISFPHCYNPSAGEVCCSNGGYCKKGTYCTNKGCCPDGVPLSECGATITLSTIPPPATTHTQPPATSTAAPPEDTTTLEGPSSVYSTSPSEPTTTASPTGEEPPPTTYTPPPSNATATSPPVTAGTTQNGGLGVALVISALGIFMMAM